MGRMVLMITLLGGIFLLPAPQHAYASHGTHLVISEIQITGGAGKTTNDFVELYNPTGAPIDLNGIRLVKRTATGTSDTTLKSWTESTLVPAHGYYIWANTDFLTIAITPDAKTSGTIADNNGIALRQGAENAGTIIDAIAWGTASNAFVEGAVFSQNPGTDQSLERKPGGADGNGTDTNNSAVDFSLQTAPNPKNAASAVMPMITPTPPESSPQAGEENSTVSPPAGGGTEGSGSTIQVTPGIVVINEFLSNPTTGGDEWIELYNRSTAAIDLTGWKLFDGTNTAIKTLSDNLLIGGFLALDLTSARLNNSGDRVMLKAPDNTLIDNVSYGDWNDGNTFDNAPAPAKSGQTLARRSNGADTGIDSDDFALTEAPTKGASNIIAVSTLIPVGGTPSTMVNTVPFPKIVINEFVSNPDDEPEWVELYNSGEVAVELTDWYLEDGSEAKTTLSGTLIPGHFKIVRDIEGSLSNKGDILRLKNDKGVLIDRVTFGIWEDGLISDNAPVAEDPNSVARRTDGKDTDNDAVDFIITAKPTKGRVNIIETPQSSSRANPALAGEVEGSHAPQKPASEISPLVPSVRASVEMTKIEGSDLSGKLIISELIPNPEGSDSEEWLELYWDGETALDLAGFKLDDEEGGSRPYLVAPTIMAPHTYLQFKKAQTGLTLNNDTDAVRLLDPKGSIVDVIEYEDAREGVSYARTKAQGWAWTKKPTPGQENNIETVTKSEAAEDNADSRTSTARGKIRVVGIVLTPPDLLSTQFFYIAVRESSSSALTEGDGTQIYSAKKQFPELEVGDRIEVTGTLGEAGGERRIKIQNASDIRTRSHGNPPAPQELAQGELADDHLGSLVTLQGAVVDVKSGGLTLDDGEKEIYVQIKKSTGITAREIVPGAQLTVTGIVGQSTNGLKLMPRFQEDLKITGFEDLGAGDSGVAPENARKQSSSPYAKATTAAFGGSALVGLAVRRRQMLATAWRTAKFLLSKNGRTIV